MSPLALRILIPIARAIFTVDGALNDAATPAAPCSPRPGIRLEREVIPERTPP